MREKGRGRASERKRERVDRGRRNKVKAFHRGIRVNKRLIGEGEIRVHRINSRGYRGRRETSIVSV